MRTWPRLLCLRGFKKSLQLRNFRPCRAGWACTPLVYSDAKARRVLAKCKGCAGVVVRVADAEHAGVTRAKLDAMLATLSATYGVCT